jgi:hypothetical protein
MGKTLDLSPPLRLPGEVLPGVLYRYTEACKRMGWSVHSARQARRNGLAVKYLHGKAYVFGDEVIRYLAEAGKDSK